jgi:hypothetical protein
VESVIATRQSGETCMVCGRDTEPVKLVGIGKNAVWRCRNEQECQDLAKRGLEPGWRDNRSARRERRGPVRRRLIPSPRARKRGDAMLDSLRLSCCGT